MASFFVMRHHVTALEPVNNFLRWKKVSTVGAVWQVTPLETPDETEFDELHIKTFSSFYNSFFFSFFNLNILNYLYVINF